MRGNGVGVGDVHQVPANAWSPKLTGHCRDGREGRRERNTDMVSRLYRFECNAAAESCKDRIGISDNTRGKHGVCDMHGAST